MFGLVVVLNLSMNAYFTLLIGFREDGLPAISLTTFSVLKQLRKAVVGN